MMLDQLQNRHLLLIAHLHHQQVWQLSGPDREAREVPLPKDVDLTSHDFILFKD